MKKKRKRESIERETKLLADRESLRLMREFHEQAAFAYQKLIDRCTCEIGEERGLQP